MPTLRFPRGENATRRYHEPTTNDLPLDLLTRAPAVLAKTPQDGRFHLLPEEIDTHTLVARRMVLDPTALDQIIDGMTSRLLAPTPSDEVLTLEFKKIKTRSATTHTLQGHVVGEEKTSVAQIVYHDGILHGSVMRYSTNQELEYRILADGHMMVRELDHATMNDNCATCKGDMADIEQNIAFSSPAPSDPPADRGVIAYDTPGWRVIDVVVGYSKEARIDDGGYAQIEARIMDSLDRMTLAFANSQIPNTEMVLVGTIEDPAYMAPGSSSLSLGDELTNLRNENDGVLDTVTNLSNRLGADLVSFVTPAGQGGQSGVANGGNRYSINSRIAMTASQMVMAHEMGHNMGCGHAWGDSSKPTAANTGWRFKTPGGSQLSTIMAYTDGWGARVPYYSNPNVLYEGVKTGAVNGYDATGDTTVDQRLVVGGLRYGPTDFGFDGNTPSLGANNADMINTGTGVPGLGATSASNWKTRTAFNVISPAAAAQWERGTTQTIRFNGGDTKDLATIKLYKGGLFHSTIASGINPATNRNFTWTVPFALTDGTDYMIRVELVRNGGTEVADSGIFTIFSDPPYVTTSSAPAVPENVGVVSKVVLTFNVPMDPATFSAGSDIVSFTDPIGNSVLPSITGTSWSAGNTVLTIDFTPPSQPGTYQLVVGPNIADTVGSLMDQDQDGSSGELVDDRHISVFAIHPPVIYQANMDTDPGWTFSANNPASNGWAYGQPTGQGANPYSSNDPISGFTGLNVIGYNLDGDYQTSIPDTRWATTPAFDCSAHENVTLSFKRWLGMVASDDAYIEVSNNGTSWTTVWQHLDGVNTDDDAWIPVEYDISAVAAGQATVYVRWGLGRILSSVSGSCGWNIDDVVVHGNLSNKLTVTSAGGLVSSGVYGGPFTPASIEYTLQNTGTGAIQWTAGKTSNWITLSTTSGTLAGGASTTVTVSINSNANDLEVGDYSDLVTFTNATKGIASTTRSVNLDVRGPGTLEVTTGDLASSGIYGGASGFTPASINYTLTNGGVTPINWAAAKSQGWVTLSAASGTLAPAESTTVTVSINSNANALSPGTYADTVAFLNTTNDNGNTSRAVSLLVNPSPASFYWDNNGSTAGAGTTPTGIWGANSRWNTNATGGAGTFSIDTANTANLFIVAGPASNSGNGTTTITVSGAQVANSITCQHSGAFTLSGGTSITLGNGNAGQGGINVSEFAYGTTAQGKLTIATPVILNNSQTWTNNKVDTNAQQQTAGLDLTASNTNSLTLNYPLIIDGKGVTSLSAATPTTIIGTGSITKNGTGTLILSNAAASNSGWSGELTINGGKVRYQDALNLGTGNINITGGILEGRSNSTASNFSRTLGTTANQIRITGGVSGFSAQNLTTTTFAIGTSLTWGSTNFNPSEFVLQASTASTGSAATFTSNINLSGSERTIRSDQPGSLTSAGVATFSGAISGTGASGIIKTGPGHVYFTGSNTYAGITRVNNGTLTLEDIGAAPGRNTPDKNIVAAGATLGVVPNLWGVGSIDSLRNNTTWSDKTSRLGFMLTNANSGTYSSNITQELSIHKYGDSSAALTLTGNSSYTGYTIISQGILAFNSIANVGGGNSALGAPATVTFGTIALGADNNAVTLRYTGTGHSTDRVINLSGTTGSATLDMSGTGTLTFTSALTATGAGSKTLTLTGSTAGTGVLEGVIPNNSGTNTTAVTKSGTSIWILSGNNSYTGTTAINAGKLFINGDQTSATGNVNISANATLGGTGTLGGTTTIADTGKLEFSISTVPGSHNPLDLVAGKALTFSGTSTLTITSSGGMVPGTYTLITGGNKITGVAPATVHMPTGWSATARVSSNSLLLDVVGPVDHFAISPIATPQTVGTPITGITITAQDTANQTVTTFTGTVNFAGTAGITGTSASFVAGVLSNVSVTPTVVGSNLTLTVTDGVSGKTGTSTFTVFLSYAAWANGFLPGANVSDPAGNNDGDNLTNLLEFAFGTDPTVSASGPLVYVAGGNVVTAGSPILQNFAAIGQPADYRAVFARRKDHITAGLTYTVQFSADLLLWTPNPTAPTIQTGAVSFGTMEAVSVPFLSTVPQQAGDSATPKFFRVRVSQN
ncbi:MAG: autotransporter-associated beta strand repeat-containing protein [Verrucomicrobiota bacterium]